MSVPPSAGSPSMAMPPGTVAAQRRPRPQPATVPGPDRGLPPADSGRGPPWADCGDQQEWRGHRILVRRVRRARRRPRAGPGPYGRRCRTGPRRLRRRRWPRRPHCARQTAAVQDPGATAGSPLARTLGWTRLQCSRLALIRPSQRFLHAHSDEDARRGGQASDGPHGGGQAKGIGDDAGEEGADGVAEVAPQAVDAHRRRPPRGMGHVTDGGEQGRVDHGGADASTDVSLPLIGQPTAVAEGKTGQGVSVAVLDTGADFTNPAFGSCSAVNTPPGFLPRRVRR